MFCWTNHPTVLGLHLGYGLETPSFLQLSVRPAIGKEREVWGVRGLALRLESLLN